MQTFPKGKRVGYWLNEKKLKRLNFVIFVEMCRIKGIEMIQLDLTQPLEEQGPFDVIIHKLTDLILEADQNDTQALLLMQSVQDYLDAHPETVVLDPLPAIRTLLDRCKSYQLIRKLEDSMGDARLRSPPFMVLTSECGPDTLQLLQRHGITFPFSYEGVHEFFDHLLSHLTSVLKASEKNNPCGKPCAPLEKEACSGSRFAEGEGVRRGAHQGLGCNSEVPANFQQHCVSAIATKASSH